MKRGDLMPNHTWAPSCSEGRGATSSLKKLPRTVKRTVFKYSPIQITAPKWKGSCACKDHRGTEPPTSITTPARKLLAHHFSMKDIRWMFPHHRITQQVLWEKDRGFSLKTINELEARVENRCEEQGGHLAEHDTL